MSGFRKLRADEIECRVAMCRPNGLSLLLYKDARCDQRILDETFGMMNWQNSYTRDNANCTVSVYDDEKKMWISKENTGTESNTEKEKGLASDSFKRACFNWGIGRELYTSPFIWITSDKCKIQTGANGNCQCRDRFSVLSIGYTDERISKLEILNETLNLVVFQYKEGSVSKMTKDKQKEEVKERKPRVRRKKDD